MLALVTPVLAKQNVWIVFVVRFLQVLYLGHWISSNIFIPHVKGVLEAFAFPALNIIISMWVPEKEKSAFVSFAYVGGTFGSIVTNPMCGAILATLGWEVRSFIFIWFVSVMSLFVQAVFYITASITVVWCLAWFLMVVDKPEQSKLMTQEERDYILEHRNYDDSVENQDDVPIIPLLM